MRHALITGGSRGIGAAAVRAFTAAGYAVSFFYEKNDAAAAAVSAETGAEAVRCDVADAQAVLDAVSCLPETDVLVNNAGICHYGLLSQITQAQWDRLFAVNVGGIYHCVNAVLPAMRLWYLDFRENRAGWVGLGSQLLSLSSRHPALVEPIRAWYKSLYDRIGRSSADTVRGYVAMMVFDGFFNSSKMGVMTLSDEEMDAMQMHVLREAYAARPDMLEVIEAVIGSGERM